MKVVRTPSFARLIFTPNQLAGWEDGIAYSPAPVKAETKSSKRVSKKPQETPPPLAEQFVKGESV